MYNPHRGPGRNRPKTFDLLQKIPDPWETGTQNKIKNVLKHNRASGESLQKVARADQLAPIGIAAFWKQVKRHCSTAGPGP